MTNRSLSAISKERSRDEAALDRIKHKVEIGELTTADAPDVKANIEHFAKRNE